jgi:hypothetical protein
MDDVSHHARAVVCEWVLKGNVQAEESECEQRFINPADHDARIFLPVLDVAVILESRAHVPGEQAPAHGPDESEETVDREVEVRSEANAAVQDYCHC